MLRVGSTSSRVRQWVLAAYWAGMYFLTHWPETDRMRFRPDWPFPEFDKLVHAGLYAGWAALWWWVLSAGGQRVSRSTVSWLLVGAAAYALFDELTQAIVGRHPDVLDFVCDLAGVTGVVLVLWYRTQWKTLKAANKPF